MDHLELINSIRRCINSNTKEKLIKELETVRADYRDQVATKIELAKHADVAAKVADLETLLASIPDAEASKVFLKIFEDMGPQITEGDFSLDPKGDNLLLLAIATGQEAVVSVLLEYAKTKLADDDFKTFISLAYTSSDEPYFKNTPLTLAIKKGMHDIALKLISDGANVDAVCKQDGNFSPLHLAMFRVGTDRDKLEQDKELVFSLLSAGADIGAKDNAGNIPIFYLSRDIPPSALQYFHYFKELSDYPSVNNSTVYSLQAIRTTQLLSQEELDQVLALDYNSHKCNVGGGKSIIQISYRLNASCSFDMDSCMYDAFDWGDIIDVLGIYDTRRSNTHEELSSRGCSLTMKADYCASADGDTFIKTLVNVFGMDLLPEIEEAGVGEHYDSDLDDIDDMPLPFADAGGAGAVLSDADIAAIVDVLVNKDGYSFEDALAIAGAHFEGEA